MNMILSGKEIVSFRLHLIYSIIEGVILGVLALNEFVFIRSIQGSDYQLGILFQFSTVLLILAVFFHEWSKRVKNRKRFLRQVAILTRGPLCLLFFFPSDIHSYAANSYYHIIFLCLFFIYYLGNPIIFPAINQLLKNSYRHEHFGRLYGKATYWNKIIMMLVTFFYGYLLDMDNFSFRYIFPFISVAGIASVFFLTRIPFRSERPVIKSSLITSVSQSIKNMNSILRKDKAFRHYEIGFMLYGFAFMSTVSVITIFFSRTLELNYSGVAFYKNSYNLIAIMLIPLFGRLIGKTDPRKFSALTFLSIMIFLISLIITEHLPFYTEVAGIKLYYWLIPYIIAHSVFAATMGLLYSIGSAYFCKSSDADIYQAVHLTNTGERALFAPLLGVLFYNLIGYTGTFVIAAVSLLAAIWLMRWSVKRYNVEKHDNSEPLDERNEVVL